MYDYDVYAILRKSHMSTERATQLAEEINEVTVSKKELTSLINAAITDKEKEIVELKDKVSKQAVLLSNPNLQIKQLIEKVVCEHLSLSCEDDYYSSSATLHWDDKELGSVTIQSSSED